MQTFEKLFMREESQNLYIQLHKHFLEEEFKDEFFRTNLLKAVLSVSSTIAEGYERSMKEGLTASFYDAKSYLWKVKTLVYLWKDLQYFNQEEFDDIMGKTSKMGAGLYKFIEKREIDGKS